MKRTEILQLLEGAKGSEKNSSKKKLLSSFFLSLSRLRSRESNRRCSDITFVPSCGVSCWPVTLFKRTPLIGHAVPSQCRNLTRGYSSAWQNHVTSNYSSDNNNSNYQFPYFGIFFCLKFLFMEVTVWFLCWWTKTLPRKKNTHFIFSKKLSHGGKLYNQKLLLIVLISLFGNFLNLFFFLNKRECRKAPRYCFVRWMDLHKVSLFDLPETEGKRKKKPHS